MLLSSIRLTGDEAKNGDDEVANRDLEESVPGCARFAIKTVLLQDNILIQIDPVKSERRRMMRIGWG